MKPKAQPKDSTYRPFGRGGGAPGLVDTSTGKFHREGRGNGRSVPVECKSIKWGWKKGRCKAKHVENGKTN